MTMVPDTPWSVEVASPAATVVCADVFAAAAVDGPLGLCCVWLALTFCVAE